ncbi:MAG: hypothetical protein GYA59_10105 [Chloroflexi bacterium]|nr:hypothetical protein [Chloroflexota bacterium]
MTENQKKRGGQRPGAGRPSIDAVRLDITLPRYQVDWLKKNGRVSEHIRALVDEDMKRSSEELGEKSENPGL